MKLNFLKILLLALVPIIFCTGCIHKKDEHKTKREPGTKVKVYKSGTVLLKDTKTYNTTIIEEFPEEPEIKDVHVGPEEIRFPR